LVSETFERTATTPYLWSTAGSACLTAGDVSTAQISIPGCRPAKPTAAPGKGALQLTSNAYQQFGAVVSRVALDTARGFQIVFTDAAFDTSPNGAADGLAVFLTDARLAFPSPQPPLRGGYLGYVGLVGGYLGIGFDEAGNFSSSDGAGAGGDGFPGYVPNTVAVRGAYATGNQYLGGYTGTTGIAQPLPFPLDAPNSTSRPAHPPTVRITLTGAGFLTVEIDLHDGRGYRTVFNKTVAGVNGQPALPPQVYLGFAASTGAGALVHQVLALGVTALAPPAMSFVPTQIPGLAAWYDASDPATVAHTNGHVGSWLDKSGHGNTLVQSKTASMPLTGPNIDGLGAFSFTGGRYLTSVTPSFSTDVFNASTAFVVTDAVPTTVAGSVLSAGAAGATAPRWDLRLSENGATHFDFNNDATGRLAAKDVYAGPAFWTAAGSANAEYLRKDGNTLATSTGPGATVQGAFPLAVGANAGSGSGATYPYAGTVGEILIFNRYLSPAETQSVEGYLACKWGMQNRLPANHPYRSLCPGAAAAPPLTTPAPAANALPAVPELRSANGLLALTVVAKLAPSGHPKLYYNGSTVPPTLRLLPGDTLWVNLTNRLPAMPAGSPYLNDTNLHFHGLHVSPNAPGDDSIDMLALPGQTLNYKLAIPYNQSPGLYWYHSHAHGEAERQNLSGMSGALVIDGIAKYVPALTNMPERILIVRDEVPAGQALPDADLDQVHAMGWALAHASQHYGAPLNLGGPQGTMTMGAGTAVRAGDSRLSRNPFVKVDPNFRGSKLKYPIGYGDGHCQGAEVASKRLTVNGAALPAIGIRPGEQQFWRLVNAGSDTYLDVAVDNAQLRIVELDGVPLSSGVGTPAMLTVNNYVVPPASRVEFIVTGPPAGSTAYLRTRCFDAGASGPAMPARVLAVLDPNSSLADAARPRQRVAAKMTAYRFPSGAALAGRLAKTAVTRTQTVYYSDQNTINGQAYDPAAAPQFYAQSGTVEEWTIVNTSSQVHTFHIHQIHFLVEAIDGVTQSQQFVLDNVNVPAATSAGPGTVKLKLDFSDPSIIGTFLLHCHILAHEDAGMMAKIRVGTSPPLTLSSTSLTFKNASAAARSVTVSGGKAPYAVSGCFGVAVATVSGAKVTVAPAGAGSCIFTISDASGLTASLAVSVGATPGVIDVTPNALSFATPSSPAQSATLAGGKPPYSVTGCTGVARAAINSNENGLGVTPLAAGSCSLAIADSASDSATLAVSVNSPGTGEPADNVTFHHDASRTGWYPHETTLTTANVAGGKFKLLAMLKAPSGMPAFGKVYAQPLYIQDQKTADGKSHNLVIVATATDQVYAMDETTGAVVWETNFTNPAAGITQQSWTDTGCNDVNPDVGIMGTPVIDRARDRLYVVVPTKESGVFHLRLHALSLKSGADVLSPVEVTATVALATGGTASVNATYNFNRASLLEANGNIYVPLTDHCDYHSDATHGWMLAFSAASLALTANALDVTNANNGTNLFLGSVWGSGFGPAADEQGNIYFATGNGSYNGTSDFAMSAIRAPGNLDITKASTFTPYGEAADSAGDCDLAAGGIILLPTVNGSYPRLMIVGGKCGVGAAHGGTQGDQKYVLDRDNLGGFRPGDAGALWHADTGGPMWGGPATFQDASGRTYVIYGGGNPLSTYTLGLEPISLSVQSSANVGCLGCRDQGSQPIVSSNGTTAGTAIVWALKTPGNAGGAISLYAFDALNMSHTLFSGGAGFWTMGPGTAYIGGALVSPTVANGRVYVPTDGAVAVFGLAP
jgi:FtsP/CotA-like multicopper oxidase with cupredoxin domain